MAPSACDITRGLFRDCDQLPKAGALIEERGYWRRKEELEDAEAALGVK